MKTQTTTAPAFRVAFDERSQDTITEILRKVNAVTEISWEFTESRLVVDGLSDMPITFTHFNSARAGLELYLEGYDHGYGDGSSPPDDDETGRYDH